MVRGWSSVKRIAWSGQRTAYSVERIETKSKNQKAKGKNTRQEPKRGGVLVEKWLIVRES